MPDDESDSNNMGNMTYDGQNSLSNFDAESLLAEPLLGSSSELADFSDDFEPTPIRSRSPEAQTSMVSSSLFEADLSLFEPTPIRPTVRSDANPLPLHQNRTLIDDQGFPVIRPQPAMLPPSGLLPELQPMQETLSMNQNVHLQMALFQMRQQQMQQGQTPGLQQPQYMNGISGIVENHSAQLNQPYHQPMPQPTMFPIQQQSNYVKSVNDHPNAPMSAQQPIPIVGNVSMHQDMPNEHQQLQHHHSNTATASANLHEYGHAMEKLCATMKLSAMSRTIVKQLSGPSRQGSNRSLQNQNSGRDLSVLALQASGREDVALLQKQISGRNVMLQKQLSARKGTHTAMDVALSSSPSTSPVLSSMHGRLTPPRVPSRRSIMSSKHRLTGKELAVSEGIVRHNSTGNLLGNRLRALHNDRSNSHWLGGDGETMCSGDSGDTSTIFSEKTV